MQNKLTHFAIYTEDIDRASSFYEEVFDWKFKSHGAADFLQIFDGTDADAQPMGALQDRSYSPINQKVIGFECSICVDDVEKTAKIIQEAGGVIVMPKTEIPGVGWIIKFKDTEGNLVCAIQYQEHS